ncbi:amidase [Oleiagrimonas sp. MCCC 1A03011]|uniref:amidase n=1 Tax=Oleiagrimonas sp. MCCC 1A03011 TaxID=1926883 RepID=UPI000DC45EB0|nr:amidase [Oleiagrimonas sp. MCCC 1A03011]RAP59263.1 amidase [Oleiagrimonas sp. MCCC 1A03011]
MKIWVVSGFLALSALAADASPAQTPASAPAATPVPNIYASIPVLQQRMHQGQLSAETLARNFIMRIAAKDQSGPNVNAVLEINPDALEIARQRDDQRAAAPDSHAPLLGIPVLLKDNIDTGDRMQTTAGSLALAGPPAPRDATVALKLRAAGMVLLGKTNLSEWANFRSTHSSSGWSGRGGLTRNPYVLNRTACGSSSGSAAAVAAGFVTVAIGTETDGSVICPSAANGIVGIKPTVGLVSRAGIIPISHTQDTAGPMARTVGDAARLLTAMAGSDPQDPATREADLHATDYTRFLDPQGLRGKRIGVVRGLTGYSPATDRILDQAIAAMRAAGAIVVDPVKLPHLNEYGAAEFTVLLYEFKHDLNAYLATRPRLKVHSLADLIAYNKAHADTEMPWFGQELFLKAETMGPLTDKGYIDARQKAHRLAGPEGIDAALTAQHLDALVAPTQGPAWVTDLVNGDNDGGNGYGTAAVAGYPSITVPAGFVHGLPIGVVFFAGKWSEPTLIGIAYGFEQHTHARRRPHFFPSVLEETPDPPPSVEHTTNPAPAQAASANSPSDASAPGNPAPADSTTTPASSSSTSDAPIPTQS